MGVGGISGGVGVGGTGVCRIGVDVVFKPHRAFRSVKHMHDTLAVWELVGVSVPLVP